MAEGTVETIIARCLLEPAFLAALRADAASALVEYRLDDDLRAQMVGADLVRIGRFAGFIGKVQHNYLWESFPCTRRLLRFYQIEGDVFTAFRPLQLAQAGDTHRNDRIRRFVAFLDAFISERAAIGFDYPGMAEALRHEYNIWELGLTELLGMSEPAIPSVRLSKIPWGRFKQLVAKGNGRLRIGAYRSDPVDIERRVNDGSFDGVLRFEKSIVLLYWINQASATIQLLEVDELSGLVLSQMNDRRTVRAVIDRARQLSTTDVPPVAFRALFEEAVTVGFLSLGN